MASLITEAIKKMLTEGQYSKNILVAIVSVIVSIGVSAGYMILNHVSLTNEIVVYIIALTVLSWLTSQLGYDKVIQTIKQLKAEKHDEN